MTKAQMVERISALEKEVEALKAGATVENHTHYHYPQQPTNWWQPTTYPYYVATHTGTNELSPGNHTTTI